MRLGPPKDRGPGSDADRPGCVEEALPTGRPESIDERAYWGGRVAQSGGDAGFQMVQSRAGRVSVVTTITDHQRSMAGRNGEGAQTAISDEMSFGTDHPASARRPDSSIGDTDRWQSAPYYVFVPLPG